MKFKNLDRSCACGTELLAVFKLAAAAGFLLALSLSAAAEPQKNLPPFPKEHQSRFAPQPVAHRGMLRFAPENTILSLETAYELGFRFVEIDITVSQDQHFVVFHDRHLNRVGKNTALCELPLSEIKEQRPAYLFFSDIFGIARENTEKLLAFNDPWMEKLKNSFIPSLNEVFSRFGKTLYYHLDLKYIACQGDRIEMAERLAKLIAKHGLERHAFIESQDPGILSLLRALSPKQLLIYWRDDIHLQDKSAAARIKQLGFDAIDHFNGKLDEKTAKAFSGLYLFTFTINSASRLSELKQIYDFPLTDLNAVKGPAVTPQNFFNQKSSRVKLLNFADKAQFEELRSQGYQRHLENEKRQLILYKE